MYLYYTVEELRRLSGSPKAQAAVYQNQLEEIDRRLQLIHEQPRTPENDAEYFKLITDRKTIEKRLEFAKNQLAAEEDKEKRKNEGGKKGCVGIDAARRQGRKELHGKSARNVQIVSDGEN